MRLKRSRKQPATGKESQSAAMSDDDKIRLQFTLDTEEFGRAVRHQQLSQTVTVDPRHAWTETWTCDPSLQMNKLLSVT